MVFKKRRALSFRDVAILTAIAVGVVATVGGLLIADVRIIGIVRDGGGFLAAWAGARDFIWGQHSPYTADVAAVAQHWAYGRPAIPGENPYRLTIPFFLLPLFFPLALIQSASVATGVWLCLSQAALAGSTVVTLALVEWRPPRPLLLAIGAIMVFSFYSVTALAAGTPAIVLGLVYATILWALQTRRDELAGTLLAFTFFIWEVGVLFLVLILWWVIFQRRWSVFAGLGMTLITLLAISFLLYPGWLLPFVTSTIGQLRTGYGVTFAAVMLRLSPEYGATIAEAGSLFLSLLMVYEWWSGRHQGYRRFVWTSLLALAITPLLGFRTELSNLVVLAPIVVLICAAAAQRGKVGAWFAIAMLVCTFFVPWGLFGHSFLTRENSAKDYLFLLSPLLSIVGLYWTRSWFIRPYRTWLDEVRALNPTPGRGKPDIDTIAQL